MTTVTTNRFPTALIIFLGESNSGGTGENTEALSSEIDENSDVQILNNLTLGFENLRVNAPNKNNRLDHFGADQDIEWHGWELELGNRVNDFTKPVYLIKGGQGGSVISEWNDGGAYDLKFKERFDAAQLYFTANSITPEVYIYISLGINDRIAGTANQNFYDGLFNWIERLKSYSSATKMFITTFEERVSMESTNQNIIKIANRLNYLTRIDTTGIPMPDSPNHWAYPGIKIISSKMTNKVVFTVKKTCT